MQQNNAFISYKSISKCNRKQIERVTKDNSHLESKNNKFRVKIRRTKKKQPTLLKMMHDNQTEPKQKTIKTVFLVFIYNKGFCAFITILL